MHIYVGMKDLGVKLARLTWEFKLELSDFIMFYWRLLSKMLGGNCEFYVGYS